jgi:class 3 adenylate cyclase
MEVLSPYLSWVKASVIALCCAAFLSVLSLTSLGDGIHSVIEMQVNFWARVKADRGPGLDSRIKIFSYDNATYRFKNDSDLTLEEWAKVFKRFDDAGASVIVIDKFFDGRRYDEKDNEAFVAKIKNLRAPIVAGTYTSLIASTYSSEVRRDRPEFSIPDMLKGAGLEEAAWLPIRTGFLYGPHKELENGFSFLGHFTFAGSGRFEGLTRLDETTAVPQIGLLAAGPIAIKNGHLVVNRHAVHLDHKQMIQVNLDVPSMYNQRNYRLAQALRPEDKAKPTKLINPGDLVMILPGMFTGSYDEVDTPLGKMAGGFLVTAVVNSTLTGKWLKPVGGEIWLILAGCVLATILNLFFNTLKFWVASATVLVCYLSFGVGSFVLFDMITPWFFPSLAFVATGAWGFLEKSHAFEKKSNRLKSTLEGVVSKERLADIIRHPDKLDLAPKERTVSVMFVDIVGFSVIAERLSPSDAFTHLKKLFSAFAAIIHRHGGVVDSTPGDGLLCYFGYNFDGTEAVVNHADVAVACAIEIQQQSVQQILAAAKSQEPTFPLRIGINTDAVLVGDLGGTRQLKPTIIGHGVNFSKRLEAACDFFCIMIGQNTKQLLTAQSSALKIERRPIQIKHHAEMIEAYEVDAFVMEPKARTEALMAYRTYIGIERKDERVFVNQDTPITVTFDFGVGVLVNYSTSGLAVKLNQYVGKEVNAAVKLDSSDGKLAAELKKQGLINIMVEVKWGRPVGDQYLHGLLVKNLNADQKKKFISCLAKFAEAPKLASA